MHRPSTSRCNQLNMRILHRHQDHIAVRQCVLLRLLGQVVRRLTSNGPSCGIKRSRVRSPQEIFVCFPTDDAPPVAQLHSSVNAHFVVAAAILFDARVVMYRRSHRWMRANRVRDRISKMVFLGRGKDRLCAIVRGDYGKFAMMGKALSSFVEALAVPLARRAWLERSTHPSVKATATRSDRHPPHAKVELRDL